MALAPLATSSAKSASELAKTSVTPAMKTNPQCMAISTTINHVLIPVHLGSLMRISSNHASDASLNALHAHP